LFFHVDDGDGQAIANRNIEVFDGDVAAGAEEFYSG
jgi:hypothetical protein